MQKIRKISREDIAPDIQITGSASVVLYRNDSALTRADQLQYKVKVSGKDGFQIDDFS